MNGTVDSLAFLEAQMADHEAAWSLGTFGAIAEFMRDRDEAVALSRGDDCLTAVTARGGVCINPIAGMRLFASETTTRDGWSHRMSLCLREDHCAMSRRTALTQLGTDAAALRAQDREGVLFDLGLGALQADLCVRVSDPQVVERLRPHLGRGLFELGNPAMGVLLAASPHRVFISKLGRVEVFQPIPAADGKSPEGPHTHVLPKLLQHRRTHAATEQVPDGWIPCAHVYPAHPAKNALGHQRPFDGVHHDAFQRLLQEFGDPGLYALKQQVAAALSAGQEPSAVALANDRFSRTQVRVALRQFKARDATSPALVAWLAAYELPDQIATDIP